MSWDGEGLRPPMGRDQVRDVLVDILVDHGLVFGLATQAAPGLMIDAVVDAVVESWMKDRQRAVAEAVLAIRAVRRRRTRPWSWLR